MKKSRIAASKYSAIKQMDVAMKVKSFLQNFFGEMSEEDCMRTATYIRAVRFDLGESAPLKDESPEEHAAFLAEFKQLNLDGLYGFPTFEKEVHDLLLEHYVELKSIFGAYCKTIGVVDAAGTVVRRESPFDAREGPAALLAAL